MYPVSAAFPDPAKGIEVKLDPDPQSVRAARAFVETNLRVLGFPESVDNGMLIVSEMATNALKAAADTPFLVVVRVEAERHPVIEVHDCSPAAPELLSPDFVSEGGRGLHIVDALCETWTCFPSGSGKAVIATLPGGFREQTSYQRG